LRLPFAFLQVNERHRDISPTTLLSWRDLPLIYQVMAPDQTSALSELRRVFSSSAPAQITQEPFDSTPKHLKRLARLRPGDSAEVGDLWEYAQDLLYSREIQGTLLKYLLPFCLKAWRDDLLDAHSGYGGFVEHFYPVLANKHVFDEHLTPTQTMAVSEFMRDSILEEIDAQRGLTYKGNGARPYRWTTALATYGVLLPDIDQLWTRWWSIETVGRAVATVQYVSCLMYREDENPVFAPWTPNGGGGPPCLWEFGGHLYEHRWLDPNVRFLRQILNTNEVTGKLSRAVEKLEALPEQEVAAEVQSDIPLCAETLATRCVDLPRLLEITQEPGKLLAWTK
jgi:hypothetical protein